MEGVSQDLIAKHILVSSIEREELLMTKYDLYFDLINEGDFRDLLLEFKETSREHIEILKGKLQKLNV